MSSYYPPTETTPIFNPSYFSNSTGSESITLSQADGLYVSLTNSQSVLGLKDFVDGVQTDSIVPVSSSDPLYFTTTGQSNFSGSINAAGYYINGSQIFPTIDSSVDGYILSNDGSVTEWIENENKQAGGSSNQIQFNSNGTLDGTSDLTWSDSNLNVSGTITADSFYTGSEMLIPSISSSTSGKYLSNNGSTSEWASITNLVPTISSSTSGQYLSNNGSTSEWASIGDSLTIGGSSGQIQYNNSGNLGGSSDLTFSSNTFKAFSLSANATTVALDSFLQFTGGFVNLGDYPVNITPYNGQVGYSGTNTISIYYSGYILIECWNADGSHWNMASGMVYDSKAPLLNTSGSNPTINTGYSNGNPYIQIVNQSSSVLVYYSIWIFGDGINTY